MPGPLQELTAQCSFSFLFHKQILVFVSQAFISRSSCLRHIFTLGPDYQCVKGTTNQLIPGIALTAWSCICSFFCLTQLLLYLLYVVKVQLTNKIRIF